MTKKLLVAALVVIAGATELLVSPQEAAAKTVIASCNMSLPFPCAYAEPWEAEARCNATCPNWTMWTCGTTSLTCWGEPT